MPIEEYKNRSDIIFFRMLLHLAFVLPVLLLVKGMSLCFQVFRQFTHCKCVIFSWNACKILSAAASWDSEFTAYRMKDYPVHYW